MATTNVSVGTYASNVLAASGDIVELQFAAGASDIALVLAGTFSGTVQFEAGLANLTTGVTWTALLCNPIPSGSAASSATAVGTWQASIVGFTHFRFRCSAYASGRVYATVNAALAADGGGIISAGAAHQTAVFANAATIKGVATGTSGQVLTSNGASTDPSYQDAAGGTPGSPDLSIQGNSGGDFVGIPNSSFDAATGDVTLGANLVVQAGTQILLVQNEADGEWIAGSFSSSPLYIGSDSTGGVIIDATGAQLDGGAGTGPINLTSAGGVSITDDSDAGIVITESGAGPVNLVTPILQINGTPGISGTGTTMTNITVVNGIITAATFT